MSVNTVDAQNASLLASELTGVPAGFALALIQEEGTMQQSNNPFDITKTWAIDTGFGQFVTGLWNDVGVAIFGTWNPAVQAWASGINHFSLYAPFRADLSAGMSVRQLATDLAKAGYSGGDITNFVNNVSLNYERNTGKSADAPLDPNPSPSPSPTPTPSPGSGNIGTNNTPLSFTNGILHILISGVILIVGLVAIFYGIQLIMGNKISENGASIAEVAGVA